MERLSGLDAGFLYMETPTLLMHTLKIAVLTPPDDEEGYTFDRFVRTLGERLHALPPFRRRVVEVPGRIAHPVWIEDPDFDMSHHIRRTTVAAPGGPRELDDAIAEIASTPLDRSRPLWELWALEGLADGRFAAVTKIHHAAADGVAASALLANVMTTEQADTGAPPGAQEWHAEPVPSRWRLFRDAIVHQLGNLWRLPALIGRTWRSVRRVLRRRRESPLSPPLPIKDTPNTAFNASLTARRAFATTSLSLDDVRTVKNRVGVTVNDVLLGLIAEALRSYLSARHALPIRSLVAGIPVSTDRPDDVARLGGNRVSNLFTSLRTDIVDPVERLGAIHDVTAEAKVVQNILGATMMQEWVEYTPPGPFTWFMKRYSARDVADRHHPPINLVVSNVPGPPDPLFIEGADLREIYSIGPILEGIGLNITVWSYAQRMYVSAMSCADTMPDLHDVTDAIPRALDDLLATTDPQGKAAGA
ncbi:MAG: wax ester/triacylglycerol synthase family O-acyltransferase [Acidimicrobiia bacterium]